METEALYRVTMPNGKKTKPYSVAKIRSALAAGQIPETAVVDSENGPVNVVTFCNPSAVAKPSRQRAEKPSKPQQITSSPAMFRNRPVLFVLCFPLMALYGLGLVILIIWWLKCLSTSLTVSETSTVMRRGLLSKAINEVRHKDVRNVRISQSFLQRIFGVGTIEISSAGQADVEISVSGIRAPYKIKELIDRNRD